MASAAAESDRAARPARLIGLDRLRGIVILLVVLHHAALAYCTFGHIDRRTYSLSTAPIVDDARWAGLDVLVRLNDGFFMPLMFLLSGLFVLDGLSRRGGISYLGDRLRRLGRPWLLAVLTIVPLAYYPSYLQADGSGSFPAFWLATVTTGPWPSGPLWFVSTLLVFDAAAAALPTRLRGAAWRPAGPLPVFCLLLGLSAVTYLPLLLAFGPALWIGIGPVAIQASRIGLYAAYFATGVVLGASHLAGPASPLARALGRQWMGWGLLAAAAAAGWLSTDLLRTPLESGIGPAGWIAVSGIGLAVFCASASLALLAGCLRVPSGPSPGWDSLTACSFGIYLLHYPVVTWTQFWLLHRPVGPVPKAFLTVLVAVATSWSAVALARRRPG